MAFVAVQTAARIPVISVHAGARTSLPRVKAVQHRRAQGTACLRVQQLRAPRSREALDGGGRCVRPRGRAAGAPAAVASLVASTASSPWVLWALLTACAAGGLKLERTTVGRALSGPVCAMLVAACAANLGILPPPDATLTATQAWCVRLATPLLLFGADMRRLVGSAGRLTGAFALGAAGSTLGILGGFALVAAPMALVGDPSNGDGWKLASALLAKNIGGGINYVAVAATTGVSSSAVAAGLAVDNLFGLLYFPLVNWIGSRHAADAGGKSTETAAAGAAARGAGKGSPEDPPVLPEAIIAERVGAGEAASTSGGGGGQQGEFGSVEDCLTAIAVACAASALSEAIAPAASMPVATALTVLAATAFPGGFGKLEQSGTSLGKILLFVYFASAGAAGGAIDVVGSFLPLFPMLAVLYATHLGLMLGLGPRLGFTVPEILLASNANIGNPATAATLAAARGWDRLLVPGMLVGHLGNAVATFIGLFVGSSILRTLG